MHNSALFVRIPVPASLGKWYGEINIRKPNFKEYLLAAFHPENQHVNVKVTIIALIMSHDRFNRAFEHKGTGNLSKSAHFACEVPCPGFVN